MAITLIGRWTVVKVPHCSSTFGSLQCGHYTSSHHADKQHMLEASENKKLFSILWRKTFSDANKWWTFLHLISFVCKWMAADKAYATFSVSYNFAHSNFMPQTWMWPSLLLSSYMLTEMLIFTFFFSSTLMEFASFRNMALPQRSSYNVISNSSSVTETRDDHWPLATRRFSISAT